MDSLERFHAKIVADKNGCWLWRGWITKKGYGRLRRSGRNIYAHRFSYEISKGSIPDGLTIDHLCRVRNCVNPEHLEVVTNRENILRGESPTAVNKRKTHCPQGHPYDAENTIREGEHRHCRECKKVARRNWKKRNPDLVRASKRRARERRANATTE